VISVVIPSYKRQESVLRLLEDVFRQRDAEFEVIVVDDHSGDDTVEVLRSRFPQATILENPVNSGPAVARNRGIRAARGDLIVGFDSDVTLPDDLLLSKVVRTFSERPQVDALAFRLLHPDGHSEDSPRWWHPVPIEPYARRHFFTHYFSGTGYAFRTPAIHAASLFPEILFMHYEEVELALRHLDNGGCILHCPDLTVLHHEHQVSRRTEIKVFYKPRNQVLLAVACYPLLRGIAFVAPRLTYACFKSLVHRDFPVFLRAVRSALQLGRQRLPDRRPLKSATWKRLADMRRGLEV
jgi:GT2 family glycosyltransferase